LLGGQTIRTNIYIDGFNLYYGCLKGTPYKWLDVDKLFRAILPNNDIQRIRYFTAKVDPRPGDLGITVRQMAYLRALSTLPAVEIEYGNFQSSPVRAAVLQLDSLGKPKRVAGRLQVKTRANGHVVMEWVHKSEEKGSDVNLASYLLRDAFQNDCECAVVVSNDSDLLAPIRIAKDECGITMGLIAPRAKGSVQLRQLVDFQKNIRPHMLAAAQFSDTLTDAVGTLHKPGAW